MVSVPFMRVMRLYILFSPCPFFTLLMSKPYRHRLVLYLLPFADGQDTVNKTLVAAACFNIY